MSKTETIRARIEPELKHNAETVLAALGLCDGSIDSFL
jgi:antitoxin component of RelBE/YafQ-DinJ toxin-antitoxin module